MRLIAAAILLAALLPGCGQTGPLYMPNEPAAKPDEPAADTAPPAEQNN